VYSSCKEDKKIAAVKGKDEEKVRQQLLENAQKFYKL
jgi:Tat protein secretion system quality control protein TatD with DNase activity